VGRRRDVDREAVAEVIAYAQDHGISMLRALMLVLDMSKGEAAYALRVVQREGLVERVHRSGDGHVPTRAVIHRGTPREYRWTVCQICLTWPCLRGGATEQQQPTIGKVGQNNDQRLEQGASAGS
jgi:hypothetical protein